MKRTALTLVVVLLAAGACSRPDVLSEMELSSDGEGPVSIIRDGETIAVESKIDLEPGDVIVTGDNAQATFALEGGEDVRSGSLLENGKAAIQSPTEVAADKGQLLLDVDAPVAVAFDDVEAATDEGVFRIDRGFGSSRVGTYKGEVGLEAVGQLSIDVPSYFQATVVAGDLPAKPIPYQLRLRDVWDQSILKAQVELEGQLETLGRGLQNQLAETARPALDYFGELAGQPVGFMKSYLKRRPSDLLIGFTVAQNADGNLESAFEDAFGFFDEGAKWSIAAAILEVEDKPILASLDRLIEGTGVLAADGGSIEGDAEFSVAAAEAANSGELAPSENVSGGAPPGENPGGNDPGGEDPEPKDPDDPPQECSSSAECTFNEVTDGIPRPTPSPTSATDLIDGEL